MKARVTVMLKDGVLDPQGEAVKHALNSLEYNKVESVRQGKVIEIGLNEIFTILSFSSIILLFE